MSMPSLKICRLGVVSVFIVTPAIAFADIVYETGSGGSFTIYGQFNPSYVSFDDGVSSTGQIADNSSSVSRIGFWFEQPFGENELRFRFETALGLGASEDFSQTGEPDAIDWDRTRLRHVDLQYETARYGTFYFGQGSMASDGVGDRDASGTGLATSVAIADIAGSFEFRTDAGALSGVEIGDAFVNFDGSRRGRIRYDTPEFAGFTLGVAYGEDILSEGDIDTFYDIGLGYETEFENGVEMEAGLGYQVRQRAGSNDREDTFVSVSAAFPSGINVTIATGDRNTGGRYNYGKLGYVRDIFSVGATALSVDFYSGSDTDSDGDKADSIGLAIVQDFDDQDIEAYVGYRQYSYSDTSATSYQDAASYVIGARWRF